MEKSKVKGKVSKVDPDVVSVRADNWKLMDDIEGTGRKICTLLEIGKDANDKILLTSVYNIDYLIAALQDIKKKSGNGTRVQMRFVKLQTGLIVLLKAWNEDLDRMYPEEKDQYVGLAPVSGGMLHSGFTIWSENKKEREVIEIPSNPIADVANHAMVIDSDELEEMVARMI